MSQELLFIQEDFISMVARVQPWILSHFVMWLDMKVAEFKVYGYMVLDQSSQSSTNDTQETRSMPNSKRRSRSPSEYVVPKPPTATSVLSSISRQRTQEDHTKSLNKLFLQSYNRTSVVPTEHQNSVSFDKNFSCSGGRKSSSPMSNKQTNKSRDCSSVDSVSPSIPEAVVAMQQDKINGGISIVTLCDENYLSPVENSSSSFHQNQTGEEDNRVRNMIESKEEMFLNDTTVSRQNDSGIPALYKSHQFSRLISDSRLQKRGAIDKWNDQQMESANSVKESETNPNLINSSTLTQTASGHQSQEEGPVIIKVEGADSDESVVIDEDDIINITRMSHDQSLDTSSSSVAEDRNIFTSNYFTDNGTDTQQPVPVDLVAHANMPEYSSMLSAQGSISVSSRKKYRPRKYLTSSLIVRDPFTGKFKCEQCSVTFRNRSSYFRHKRLHGEKRFNCFVCKKRFHRKEHVQLHLNRHGKSDELICPMCGFKGADYLLMESHFTAVHGVINIFNYEMDK